RLATLMNARESSVGEAIRDCWDASEILSYICDCGACWPKTSALSGANKPNPSETASDRVSLRAGLTLFVEPSNLFSIFVFYLCVEMKGVSDRSGFKTASRKSPYGFAKTNSPCVSLLYFIC